MIVVVVINVYLCICIVWGFWMSLLKYVKVVIFLFDSLSSSSAFTSSLSLMLNVCMCMCLLWSVVNVGVLYFGKNCFIKGYMFMVSIVCISVLDDEFAFAFRKFEMMSRWINVVINCCCMFLIMCSVDGDKEFVFKKYFLFWCLLCWICFYVMYVLVIVKWLFSSSVSLENVARLASFDFWLLVEMMKGGWYVVVYVMVRIGLRMLNRVVYKIIFFMCGCNGSLSRWRSSRVRRFFFVKALMFLSNCIVLFVVCVIGGLIVCVRNLVVFFGLLFMMFVLFLVNMCICKYSFSSGDCCILGNWYCANESYREVEYMW